MSIRTKRIVLGTLIVLNCITIFYFSHQVADTSSKQSSRVVEWLSNWVPFIKNMAEPEKTLLKEEILTPIVRKTAHFSIYGLLGIFTICFAYTLETKKNYSSILLALAFCFFYAISDEFHQTFIAGRSGEVRDVLLDTAGALVGILFILGGKKIKFEEFRRKKVKKNKKN